MSNATIRKKARIDKTILSCLRLVMKGSHMKELLMANIWLISGGFLSIIAIFEKNFYNSVANLIKNPIEMNSDQSIRWLCIWVFSLLVISLINSISTRSKNRMRENMNYYIRENLMKKVSRIELSYFDDIETHNKFNWVKTDLSSKISLIITSSFGLISFAIQFVIATLVILSDSYIIAIVLLAGCIPSIILSAMQTEENYRNEQYNSHEIRYQTYLSWVMFKRPYMKEMRFGNLYEYIRNKFEDSVLALDKKRKAIIQKYTFATGGARLISYVALGISLGLVSYQIYKGRLGIGSFMLIYSSSKNMQAAFEGLFLNVINIANDGRFIEDYEAIMAYKEEMNPKQMIENIDYHQSEVDMESAFNYDIEFKNVTFKYPGTDRIILDNLSVQIKAGEKISIVGENGCGKSTFIALLCGLYRPDSGHIYIGGLDIHDNKRGIRDMISCTFQDFGRYEMSIADNVRIGDLSNVYTDDEIRENLKLSDAYGFVSEYYNEINTFLGFQKNSRDDAISGRTELSGGQWQKIAMTRGLLKKDAKILILDEPTAALDPLSESKLYSDFSKLTGDKTVLLVSHRLGATRLADRILVFSGGTIVEVGSHDELIKSNGMYTEMYHSQAQWYVV